MIIIIIVITINDHGCHHQTPPVPTEAGRILLDKAGKMRRGNRISGQPHMALWKVKWKCDDWKVRGDEYDDNVNIVHTTVESESDIYVYVESESCYCCFVSHITLCL